VKNLATQSDVKILAACSDEDRQGILLRLYKKPATQKELIAELQLSSGTISKHMRVLEEAGLVLRSRSHSPYRLTVGEEIWQLLRATTNVSQAISRLTEEAIEERSKELQRAVMTEAEESARSRGA